CVTALVALGRSGEGADAAGLGYVGLLLGEQRDVAGVVARTLGPIIDHAPRRGTVLVRTLEAYFGAGDSPARAADRLHVHVNTVTQRLDRIAKLAGAAAHRPQPRPEPQRA